MMDDVRRLLGFVGSALIVCACSERKHGGTGLGSQGSGGRGSSAPRPHEDMALIPGGVYSASDPAFAPDETGACGAQTLAQVKALANQLPWPDRPQDVAAFLIDKRRVTRTEYRACVKDAACPEDTWSFSGSEDAARPTLDEAIAYCRWREAKLPTLLQWQAAIRGMNGRSVADCDGGQNVRSCTIASESGVHAAVSSAGPGEFTSTLACWYRERGDGGELLPVVAVPHREQLYMFVPEEPESDGQAIHAEFRCARNQVAAMNP
jgi:hypothetical protein